jgi:hypothetical protein
LLGQDGDCVPRLVFHMLRVLFPLLCRSRWSVLTALLIVLPPVYRRYRCACRASSFLLLSYPRRPGLVSSPWLISLLSVISSCLEIFSCVALLLCRF